MGVEKSDCQNHNITVHCASIGELGRLWMIAIHQPDQCGQEKAARPLHETQSHGGQDGIGSDTAVRCPECYFHYSYYSGQINRPGGDLRQASH